jgi:purine-nucleoside phosphorylase
MWKNTGNYERPGHNKTEDVIQDCKKIGKLIILGAAGGLHKNLNISDTVLCGRTICDERLKQI